MVGAALIFVALLLALSIDAKAADAGRYKLEPLLAGSSEEDLANPLLGNGASFIYIKNKIF